MMLMADGVRKQDMALQVFLRYYFGIYMKECLQDLTEVDNSRFN
ncbi:MAG: hypothetical protein ABIE03_06500 [Patescibacteria group bacterium]